MAIHEQDFLIEAAFREGIWQVGIETRFASGKVANNRADWEGLFVNQEDQNNPYADQNFELTEAGKFIVPHLVEMVDVDAPDLVGGVPTGGQRFAMVVGRELTIPVVRFKKVKDEPGLKTYDFETPEDRAKLEEANQVDFIEDATTEFTSLVGLSELEQGTPGEREVNVRAIHRRDDGTNEKELPHPIDWLIELKMPNIITPDHPTFQKWGHLAKGELK